MRRLLPFLILLATIAPVGAAVLPPGETLTGEALMAMVEDQLLEQSGDGRLEIAIEQPALPLPGRSTQPTTLRLDGLDWDRRAGRFGAMLVAELPSGEHSTIIVRGRASLLMEVAVPNRTLWRGAVIEARDLERRWLRASQVPDDAMRDITQLTGAESLRSLPRGRAVRTADVAVARLVRRGDLVSVLYRGNGLELGAVGEALDDAAVGETVRVVNVDSRAMRRATVVGPRRVEIVAEESP